MTAPRRAAIVYWHSNDRIRRDGGGLRVAAWEAALEAAGYEPEVIGLWTVGGGVAKGSALSALKRTVLPMPLSRGLPGGVLQAELVVATVPAVFRSALKHVPSSRLILDWMDLWSINARNIGDARRASWVGGRAQSLLWQGRESRWVAQPRGNAYAGYSDYQALDRYRGASTAAWLPTPVPFHGSRPLSSIDSIGFIGNLDYPPNRLSLASFLRRYAAELRRRDIRILVAGFGSSVVPSWGYPVDVIGEVADVKDFYDRIDAAVVPVEHGGGIKVKAVEALSYGVPVFATDHVRDGFSPEFRPYLQNLDDLLRPEVLTASSVPSDLFERHFSPQAFAQGVRDLLGSGA